MQTFLEFLDSDEQILICTHATFRFACAELDEKTAEWLLDSNWWISPCIGRRWQPSRRRRRKHHARKLNGHIIAMTGSYFRGDNVPVLMPEDEIKFTKVTYNYYQQLNGYEYLKSLGIGYHFYTGATSKTFWQRYVCSRRNLGCQQKNHYSYP